METSSKPTFLERLWLRMWGWRLRGLRCTQCAGLVDQIEIDGDGTRITAHCPACDHWDDWRRG